jgi:hypothetical protein
VFVRYAVIPASFFAFAVRVERGRRKEVTTCVACPPSNHHFRQAREDREEQPSFTPAHCNSNLQFTNASYMDVPSLTAILAVTTYTFQSRNYSRKAGTQRIHLGCKSTLKLRPAPLNTFLFAAARSSEEVRCVGSHARVRF